MPSFFLRNYKEDQLQKESFYFSHDANAHIDDKILELRAEYDWEGYGIFWVIIEILRGQTDYTYSLSKMSGLSIAIGRPKQWLIDYINHCIYLGLFVENEGDFYSESLMLRMEQIDEKRKKRAEAGRLGGLAKAKAEQSSSNAKANPSKESKVKESKVNEMKVKIIYNADNFDYRLSSFRDSVLSYRATYDDSLLKAFFEYWTEKNNSGYKMRFEKEKTWDLAKRLKRWSDNNFNVSGKSGGYSIADL